MTRLALPSPVRTFLLSEQLWWLLPTPTTVYLNRERVHQPSSVPALPATAWSRRERHTLLASSEERLRNIEGKGPGLATVSAVIVGAVLLAITGGWNEGALPARILLTLAAFYAFLSLLMPLYLVGPLARETVGLADLEAAVASEDAEEALANSAATAAMKNDLRNLRLTNLLDAARRELAYALALVVLWTLLVPVTGVLKRDSAASSQQQTRSGQGETPAK
jgi:hypothetical protein